ncbi:MAG: hydroxymethylbilane synthase [Acidiferrobacteraceae bacterium]|nr:hydroxymethylbilane synthase [Acidiferrobacteraceae bacterium]
MTKLRIGTRKSKLALWQANYVSERLQSLHSDIQIELIAITTQGDRQQKLSLSKEGGKGLFLKELEECLLRDQIDVAVHSMKDVTVSLPIGLHIAAICNRGDPRDALVSTSSQTLRSLQPGARVGTCSLRRQCLIKYFTPWVQVRPIRGNVQTRLERLDRGDFDALVLANVGLQRLGLEHRATDVIPIENMLPAAGQGAIGLECRADDQLTNSILESLNDRDTEVRVNAERAANEALNAGCESPVAFYCEIDGDILHLRGMVGDPDGQEVIFCEHRGSKASPKNVGYDLAKKMQKLGAQQILNNESSD